MFPAKEFNDTPLLISLIGEARPFQWQSYSLTLSFSPSFPWLFMTVYLHFSDNSPSEPEFNSLRTTNCYGAVGWFCPTVSQSSADGALDCCEESSGIGRSGSA